MGSTRLDKYLNAWQAEDSHRGRLARAYRANLHNRAEYQRKRIAMLRHYAEVIEGISPKIAGMQYL